MCPCPCCVSCLCHCPYFTGYKQLHFYFSNPIFKIGLFRMLFFLVQSKGLQGPKHQKKPKNYRVTHTPVKSSKTYKPTKSGVEFQKTKESVISKPKLARLSATLFPSRNEWITRTDQSFFIHILATLAKPPQK